MTSDHPVKRRKKLIEVAIPLDGINKASVHEKMPGISQHPRGIHHWWARRPFGAARAILFAQLVDDPSAVPELFPDEASQEEERKRLFELTESLSSWDNTWNRELLGKLWKTSLGGDSAAVFVRNKHSQIRSTHSNPVFSSPMG